MILLNKIIQTIEPASLRWRGKATERILQLTMPPWALGRLLDLAVDLAGMARTLTPSVGRRCIAVMCGDHGVARDEEVSAFPQVVTVQMVQNFVNGGAGVNVLGRQAGARVIVADVGVAGDLGPAADSPLVLRRRIANGTQNMAAGPAMSREQAVAAVETGAQIALDQCGETDLFATGEMGIGNTTPSSAVVSVLCGVAPEMAVGRGTGVDDARLAHKVDVVRRSIAVNQPDAADPMDVLAKVGGYEIGAIAGFILGAASIRKPVLVDGFISTAGALLAQGMCPASADYMIASHRSQEPGHDAALAQLGKSPLLDLSLRLGEGTGAALAMHLVEGAVRILTEMATFADAGVSGAA